MARHITISDLRPGDLLFSYQATRKNRPSLESNISRAIHVSMVTEVGQYPTSSGGTAWGAREIHQVEFRRNRVYQNDIRPPLDHPLEGKESERTLRVMRCRVSGLRNKAAIYARRWLSWQTPFAGNRVTHADQHERGFIGRGAALVAEQRRLFDVGGKFRAIKYAARRKGPVCYPAVDGERGMFCSMFVTTCYQVAGLKPLVQAMDVSDPSRRVSDKKLERADFKRLEGILAKNGYPVTQADLQAYLLYCMKLRSLSLYDLGDFEIIERRDAKRNRIRKVPGRHYVPSILLWASNQSIAGTNWPAYITAGMQVDSKIVMPTGLYLSLLDDKQGWRDMGYLIGPGAFTETGEERGVRMDGEANLGKDLRAPWMA